MEQISSFIPTWARLSILAIKKDIETKYGYLSYIQYKIIA